MDIPSWQKQTRDKPLFPDLIWSRPENRAYAGKLLVIGGNLHGFNAPAEAFGYAEKAGVGVVRVLLPLSVRSLVQKMFPDLEYAAANPSGSFAQGAISEWFSLADWADSVLLAGDFGRNSETAIVIEQFARRYSGQLVVVKDAIDYAIKTPDAFSVRPDTTLVMTMAQLQKYCIAIRSPLAITLDMGIAQLAHVLAEITSGAAAHIIVKHDSNIHVAVDGQVSTTRVSDDPESFWRVKTASYAAVWWAQNPSQPYASLTTAIQQTFEK